MNARPAAKLTVTNPKKRSEKKPGLRLIKPALHVALTCPWVTTKHREGDLSISALYKLRPWWVKDPSLVDGPCRIT